MKVIYIIQTTLLTTLISFFAPSRSHATVSFHWSFDQTQYVVGPTDQFSIGATLFNDASSSGALVFGAFSVGAFFGVPQWPYRFSFGPSPDWRVHPWLQFTDGDVGKTLTLAPGQGFNFVWGVMIPSNGYAPVGSYGPPWAAELGIGGYNQDTSVESDNTFQVVVVPEPAVGVLVVFVGIVVWSVNLRRFTNR